MYESKSDHETRRISYPRGRKRSNPPLNVPVIASSCSFSLPLQYHPSIQQKKLNTMSSTTSNSTTGSISNTISDAANYVKETVQEYSAASSKEKNKEIAKGNTNASLTDRASAGLSALGDKAQESGHGAKADAHKEAVKH
ncbi:uncharacterized protein JCM15063_006392 [Sporobolomyces koalae]|uniref:uncharacterized protein n=1 Tax=Sporobolomyces koalae TaxID=500713 RepID=UPI00317C991D